MLDPKSTSLAGAAPRALARLALLAAASGLLGPAAAAYDDELPAPVEQRLEDPLLKQALMGGLLYLDDTQIRQRQGRGDPRFDACSGDGCRKTLPGSNGALPLPLPFVQNRSGEWANFIHIFPEGRAPWQAPGEALVQVQDSNLFMATTTAYPLYLFDESALPRQRQIVRDIRAQTIASIGAYRRGDGYAFWPQLPGSSSDAPRVGPLNIPMVIGNAQYLASLLPGVARRSDNPRYDEWSKDLFDRTLNPYGVDALANIPNDTDDTALAITTLHLDATFDQLGWLDRGPIEAMLRWRDEGRSVEDGRDRWKLPGSGGFLTWLKDEDLPRRERFATPETGVIPLGVNNVDCVVNANALAALGFAGEADHPAAWAASALMARAAEMRAWPECGLYYPQRMMFPYTLSRAYRDAGVRNPAMRQAMRRLLFDLLRDQQELARREPRRRGAFPGGADSTYDLPTALALSALLNIGEEIAREARVEADYHRAVADAVAYLLAHQRDEPIRFADTFNRNYDHERFPSRRDTARTWDSGLFYSASRWSLAQWRSQAYTTAMVVEALAKYALGHDFDDAALTAASRRLRVLSYARNAKLAGKDFMMEVTGG
jgi:hypothetical protein